MLPWLTYCILIFFAPLRGGLYMSFILSLIFCTFFYKNYTANHRSFQLFSVVYVLYIINRFLGKIPINILPQFAMPVSTFFENYVLILSIMLLHILSQYSTFLMPIYTCSLIAISWQIRASIFYENSV